MQMRRHRQRNEVPGVREVGEGSYVLPPRKVSPQIPSNYAPCFGFPLFKNQSQPPFPLPSLSALLFSPDDKRRGHEYVKNFIQKTSN